MSSCIINAGNDGCWVGELVLFEKTIEGLLKDFFVSEVGSSNLWASQNFVSVGTSVETDLVEFTSFPVVIEVSEPFVDFQVVESDVGNNFLLKGWAVGSRGDSVFVSESFELFVSVKAVFDGLRNLISEGFDQIDEL